MLGKVLAMIVFLTVIIIGFAKNGLGFLKLFVPSGVPIFVLPLVAELDNRGITRRRDDVRIGGPRLPDPAE